MANTGAVSSVKVKGLRELDRAFKAVSKDMQKGLRAEWKVVAEPVRRLAEQLAVGNITNIGSEWSRMRVGVTAREVYVAPAKNRAGGSPRKILATYLMDKAMQPALDQKTPEIVLGIERLIDKVADRNGF